MRVVRRVRHRRNGTTTVAALSALALWCAVVVSAGKEARAGRDALREFYKKTGGGDWSCTHGAITGWHNPKSDPCADGWTGVECMGGRIQYVPCVRRRALGRHSRVLR